MSLFKSVPPNPALAKIQGQYNITMIAQDSNSMDVQCGTIEFDGRGNLVYLPVSLPVDQTLTGPQQGTDYTVDPGTCSGTFIFRQHKIASKVANFPLTVGFVADPAYTKLSLVGLDVNAATMWGWGVKIS
jgi:hypothetical protein